MGRRIAFWTAVALSVLAGVWLRYVPVGYSFSSLVCFLLAGLLLCFFVIGLLRKKYPRTGKWVLRCFVAALAVLFAVIAVTEVLIIHASFGDPELECRYMVVLGCLVRRDGPSVSLRDRINAAYAYMTAHPEVICIASGGRGPDEPMSEAQCIRDHLVAMGIDPERIWLEEQATSTWENLKLSLDLIEAKTGERPQRLGVLSSEYHLFRAGIFAAEQGVEMVGIPASTSIPSMAVNHFMREVAGVWHYLILGGQYD